MRKNNNFLNQTTPSTHIFLQRKILHHYNLARNQKIKNQYSKIVPPDVSLQFDSHGRVVLGMGLNNYAHLSSSSTLDNKVCCMFFLKLTPHQLRCQLGHMGTNKRSLECESWLYFAHHSNEKCDISHIILFFGCCFLH